MYKLFRRLEQERIERVKFLLEYSEYSYAEIAKKVSEEYKYTLGSYTRQSVMNVNKKYKVRN